MNRQTNLNFSFQDKKTTRLSIRPTCSDSDLSGIKWCSTYSCLSKIRFKDTYSSHTAHAHAHAHALRLCFGWAVRPEGSPLPHTQFPESSLRHRFLQIIQKS